MDVISISDSTEVSAGIHSLLLHYSVAKGAAGETEGSPLTEGPLSLSSESSERCPVTWRSKQKKKVKPIKNLINEKTPCATAKVQSWLTRNSQKGNFDSLQLEALDGSTVLRLEPLQKGASIFIRHDYNKDLISYSNAKPYYLSRNVFSAKKNSEVICLDSSDDSSDTNPSDHDINTPIEDKVPQKKPRQKAADVPLSPESRKKSELCSYLQLMDMSCTDKKIGGAVQNRRSVRVQNLNMLSERKKLEKELLTEPKECADVKDAAEVQENDKELAKKSFAELKINVPKENHEDAAAKSKPSSKGAMRNNFLSFEALPKNILECSVDFDEVMGAFIDAEKIPIPIKPARVSPKRNSPQKYRNLRGSRKLILIKKKEGKKNSLSKKKSSPMRTVKKRHKLLSSIRRKLRRRKSPPHKAEAVTNSKLDEVATNVNACETTIVNKDLPQQNSGDESPQRRRRECAALNVSKKKLEERRRPKENKTMLKAFREKSFCVIDLSHQHDYTTDSGTLLDHNYASKPESLDKNYIMNVIVGQPFTEDEKKRGANFTVTIQKPDAQFDDPKPPPAFSKLKANGQQKPAATDDDDDEEEPARKKKKKKKKLSVTPVQRDYPDFGDELGDVGKVFGDEINLTVDERPPANIFDDSDYLKSPVSLSETCMKEILDNLGRNDSNNEGGASPIIGRKRTQYVPFNSSLEVKPLHKSLMRSKRKLWPQGVDSPDSTWDEKNISGGGVKRRDDKRSYAIQISKRDGCVLSAFYLDFNLIVAQEQVISFWSQSALGNMLGAQNMWISKGSVQRLVTDGNCIFKRSNQAVISLENSVAYVELWIKEHKSDKRERPVADIFATIYFCRHRLNGPDKKVLQLENINGVASDVQYVVLRNSRNIIVSWCETCDDARRTYIHCYNLASDYQTVVSIREMGNVSHYITSLHNIEDCDTLVMGCGEHKVSLWNVEYSYVVATIEIDDIRSEPSTLWVKCDRGFLFMLLFYELEKMFKLIAINGIHHSWKRLKMFTFPSGYKGLRGVCLDNNILGAFYDNGVVCWNIQTGESVIEEMCSENVYIPSEKHIIILSQGGGILVRHALSHFITSYDL